MSDKPNERNTGRQSYEGPVWLKPEAGSSLVGDVRNVSRGGMFVNVVPTPPIGEEVLCELPGYRAVRGRVVWVSSPADFADHGVGIEFVDLSEKPTPILAMPSTTYAGIELQGPLDFLEEGSEVHIAAPNGHRQLRARIADVVMDHTGGATHLALSLVISPAITPAIVRDADEDWFPEVSIEAPRVATPIAAHVAPALAPVTDPAMVLPFADVDSDGGPLEIAPADSKRIELTPSATDVVAAPEAVEPKPAMLEAIEPENTDRQSTEAPMVEEAILTSIVRRDSQLDDTLALAPGTTDDTDPTFLVTPAPVQPARARVFVPFAAVTGLILAGLAILRVGFPTADQPAPLPVAPLPAHVAPTETAPPAKAVWTKTAEPAQAEPAQEPAQVEPVNVPVKAEPVKAEPVKAEPAHVVPAAHGAPVAVDPATWKPEVTQSKGEPSVLVPLKGSTKGMSSFDLDKPNGISVDLPNAQLAVTAKSYLLHNPSFASLWVRQMPKGLQIRLHVAKGVKLEAVLEDGALRIRKK